MIKVNKFLLAIIIVFTLLLLPAIVTQTVNAQQSDIKYEDVNPQSGFKYSFKRLQEKIMLLFAFSETSKLDVYQNLLNRRLSELKFVVDKKDISNIQTVSQRYAQTAGEVTEFIQNTSSSNKQSTKKLLESHLLIIKQFQNNFDNTTAEWRFLKHDEDYLRIYISNLSK